MAGINELNQLVFETTLYMKKIKTVLTAIAIFSSMQVFCQEDYIIHFNDTTLNVALNKQYNLTVKGQKLDFKITQKDTLSYVDNFFSFEYLSGFKVSKVTLDVGIEQISILTAEGSGILIQSYESFDPTSLNEIMMKEITKESINYGYESNRSTYKKILKSGHELEIIKNILKYKDDINIYELTSFGKKDSGILIVTIRMDENENSQGSKVIELMWKSLKVKL